MAAANPPKPPRQGKPSKVNYQAPKKSGTPKNSGSTPQATGGPTSRGTARPGIGGNGAGPSRKLPK